MPQGATAGQTDRGWTTISSTPKACRSLSLKIMLQKVSPRKCLTWPNGSSAGQMGNGWRVPHGSFFVSAEVKNASTVSAASKLPFPDLERTSGRPKRVQQTMGRAVRPTSKHFMVGLANHETIDLESRSASRCLDGGRWPSSRPRMLTVDRIAGSRDGTRGILDRKVATRTPD